MRAKNPQKIKENPLLKLKNSRTDTRKIKIKRFSKP